MKVFNAVILSLDNKNNIIITQYTSKLENIQAYHKYKEI